MRRVVLTRDERRAVDHYYRARQYGAVGDVDGWELEFIRTWWGDRCLACGATDGLSVDHVVPLSRGGSNSIVNLQILCGPCNSSKGARIVDYRAPLALVQLVEVLYE